MIKLIQLILIPYVVFNVNCLKINNLVGHGYDVFKGNPKSKTGADPGFHTQIFQITYNQNRVTNTGSRIPDELEFIELNSYHYDYYQNEYTGMQEYQNQLKNQAKIDYNGLFFKTSFTSNTEFNQVKTTTENSILIESNAKNELYTLRMNLFNMLPLTDVFRSAILSTLNDPSVWRKIFDQYGTHFIHKTIVGGRASYQYKLTSKDYQELKALDVDIKLSASYKMFSVSNQMSHGDKKVESFKRKSTEFSMIYVGGEPPRDNDFIEWTRSVKQNPVPIQYELKDLSYLFTQNNFPSLDAHKLNLLRDNYFLNIKSYCESIGCYEPGPDRPLPNNIATTFVRTDAIGGNGGDFFQDSPPSNNLMRVRKVFLRSGRRLDGMQFLLSDGINTILTPWRGGNGGTFHTYDVPDDEYIQHIELYTGRNVDSITFITNKGTKSSRYGGGGGGYHLINVEPYLVGIHGRFGNVIDKLGFISNRIIY